ncbi:hypothetical protein MRX96_054423 [Rhipicephalus microplus]
MVKVTHSTISAVPVSVAEAGKVRMVYSAEVVPASLCAVTRKLYQVSGRKWCSVMGPSRGCSAREATVQGPELSRGLYWTARCDTGQPDEPDAQEDGRRVSEFALADTKAFCLGDDGTAFVCRQ